MDYSASVTSLACRSSLGSCQYALLHLGHVLGLSRYGEFRLGIHSWLHRSHLKPSSFIRAITLSVGAYCAYSLYHPYGGVSIRLPRRPSSTTIVYANSRSCWRWVG